MSRSLVELTALAERLGHWIRIVQLWPGDLPADEQHATGYYWRPIDRGGNFLPDGGRYYLGRNSAEAAEALHNLDSNNPGPELPAKPQPPRRSREGVKNLLASAADSRRYVKRLRAEADQGNVDAIGWYLYLKSLDALVDKPTLVTDKPRESIDKGIDMGVVR